MIGTRKLKTPRRLPLEQLIEQARSHQPEASSLDVTTPIDRRRFFVLPELTPLYHTEAYHGLADEQALRYNQLTGIAFNELITFLETEIGARVFAGLISARGAPAELVEYLRFFEEEERRHAEMWRDLNRLSEPDWYLDRRWRFMRVPIPVRQVFSWTCGHPTWFPLYLWIMLIQEELAVEYARRALHAAPGLIEPRYLEAHRLHLRDEIRHVQIDWYLIEHFYETRSAAARRFNASLFRRVVREFFLSPTRVGARVINALVEEFPELTRARPRLLRELLDLERSRDYQAMLYSRETHPITFCLFDRFEEFHRMRDVLLWYEPESTRGVS